MDIQGLDYKIYRLCNLFSLMTDLHEDVKKMRNTEQDISAKAKTMEYHTGASQVLKH